METKGITIPIRTEVEPNDHLDRAVKALERIADALEKNAANQVELVGGRKNSHKSGILPNGI